MEATAEPGKRSVNRWIGALLKRPTGVICSTLAVCIAGVAGIGSTGVSLLPPVDIPIFTVNAEYTGLPAEEMQELVTIPIERGLSALEGLQTLESTTRAGVATVQVMFDWSSDSTEAGARLREAVDTMYPHLPDAVKRPEVSRIDPGADPAIRLAVFPVDLEAGATRRLASRELRARIQQLDGVGQVVVSGGVIDEIHVTADPQRIAARNIRLADLHTTIVDENQEYTAGSLHEGNLELFVTADARLSSIGELRRLNLPRRGERERIRMSELVSIEPGHAPRRSVFMVDGREAVGMEVFATPESSPAGVAARVRDTVPGLRDAYGSAVDIQIAHDGSGAIINAIVELALTAAIGMGAAFCILMLFLSDLRSAAIVALAVPVSLAFAFSLLALLSIRLNLMSLAGLTIGIGMVVDNSIVVVENLNRRCTLRCTLETATGAVTEVAGATFTGTLTTIVVFLPLLGIPGIAGQVYRELAIAVIAALAASYIVSITLIPVVFLYTPGTRRLRGDESEGMRLAHSYARVLRFTLRRPAVIVASLLVLTVTGGWLFLLLPVKLMERVDTGQIEVSLRTAPETSIEEAAARARKTAEFITSIEGIRRTVVRVGGEKDDPRIHGHARARRNATTIDAYLASGVSGQTVAAQINSSPSIGGDQIISGDRTIATSRGMSGSAGAMPASAGGQPHVGVPDSRGVARVPEHEMEILLGAGSGVGIAVYGDSAEESLRAALHTVAASGLPATAFEVYPSSTRESIIATPIRSVLNTRNIEIHSAAAVLRAAIDGAPAGTLLLDGHDMDIRLFLGSDTRLTALEALPVSSGPDSVPLGDLLDLRREPRRAVLTRREGRHVTYVTPPAEDSPAEDDFSVIHAFLADAGSEPHVEHLSERTVARHTATLIPVFALAVLIMATIIAVQFENLHTPAIVLGVLPAGASGAVLALHIAGRAMTMQASLGLLVLVGVVVNGSLVLAEHWRRMTDAGVDLSEAVFHGTLHRLRPVVMTTLTTIAAILPMAIDGGRRSFHSDMAITMIGGLAFGTAVTLFLVPTLYLTLRGKSR